MRSRETICYRISIVFLTCSPTKKLRNSEYKKCRIPSCVRLSASGFPDTEIKPKE